MKKFRFLTVFALAISMLFVVAAAADINVSDVEYNGADETITVTVKAATALEIDAFSNFVMTYDSTVFSVASASSSDAAATINTTVTGKITWSNPSAATNTAVGDDILVVVFNVTAADKTAAIGKQFVVSDANNTTMWTPTDSADYNGTITVKAAASDERVDGAVTNATKSELLLGDTWYQNLAVFDTAITLDPAKNAKQYGWTLKAAGKDDKEVSYSPATAISGEGSVAFAAIVYNVPENVTVTAVPFVVYGN